MAHFVFFTKVLFLNLFFCFILAKQAYSDRSPPNFVYILTDDQDLMLNGLVSAFQEHRWLPLFCGKNVNLIMYFLGCDEENTQSRWGQGKVFCPCGKFLFFSPIAN